MATSVPPLSVRWLRALGWESSSRFSTGHPLCDSGVRPHLSVLFLLLWDDHMTTVQTRQRCVRKRDSDRAGCWLHPVLPGGMAPRLLVLLGE